MADISQLNSLAEPDPLEGGWDNYEEGGGGNFKLPPAGKYFGRAPDSVTFDVNHEGRLVALLDPIEVVQAPDDYNGHQIRFTRISTKKFPKRNANMMGDYLRAHGSAARPTTNQEYADAVEQTAGRVFPFFADWEAYDKETGESIRGMDSFPSDGNGGHLPYIEKDGRRVWANLRIRYFLTQGT